METLFLREAPTRIDVDEGNVYFTFSNLEIIVPLKVCRIGECRLQRTLGEHDAKSAEIFQLPRRGNGHAATS